MDFKVEQLQEKLCKELDKVMESPSHGIQILLIDNFTFCITVFAVEMIEKDIIVPMT